jgi:hypothetical protein
MSRIRLRRTRRAFALVAVGLSVACSDAASNGKAALGSGSSKGGSSPQGGADHASAGSEVGGASGDWENNSGAKANSSAGNPGTGGVAAGADGDANGGSSEETSEGGRSGASSTADAGDGGRNGAPESCDHDTNFDIRATTISGVITVAGAESEDAALEPGSLVLRNGHDTVLLSAISSRSTSYTAVALPATYDLFFEARSASPIDHDVGTKLRAGIVVGSAPVTLNIDVRLTRVSGTVSVNGAALTTPSTEGQAQFWLASPAGDSFIALNTAASGPSSGRTYSTAIVPGTYDLYYRAYRAGSLVPGNRLAMLRSGIVVPDAEVAIDLDVPATKVSTTMTIAGKVLKGAMRGASYLMLRNAAGDAAPLVVEASDGAASALLVPGTYDLYYEPDARTLVTSQVRNSSTRLRSGIVVGKAPIALDVDVPATPVQGKYTIQGSIAGVSGTGVFSLRGAAGDRAELDATSEGTYSAVVAPGTYDLYYSRPSDRNDLPRNAAARVKSGIVVGSAPVTLDFDVPATTISGALTVNHVAIGDEQPGNATVSLVGADRDEIVLGKMTEGSYRGVVVPGTYDVYYSMTEYGRGLPDNISARLERGLVLGTRPVTLDVDVPSVEVSGIVTVNGALVTDPSAGSAALILVSVEGGNATLAPTTITDSAVIMAGGRYVQRVIPGPYYVDYTIFESGSLVPRNISAYLGCLKIP